MPKQLTIAEAQQQLPNLPNELTYEPIVEQYYPFRR
jgi:hypothetical protein